MNLSTPINIFRKENESYNTQLNKFDISILALPLFVKDKALNLERPEHCDILNMDNVNMRLCGSHGVESITKTINNLKSKEVLDTKCTLVLYKSPQNTTKSTKKSHYSLIVSHTLIKNN